MGSPCLYFLTILRFSKASSDVPPGPVTSFKYPVRRFGNCVFKLNFYRPMGFFLFLMASPKIGPRLNRQKMKITRRGPTLKVGRAHFYRGGRGVAESAFSFLMCRVSTRSFCVVSFLLFRTWNIQNFIPKNTIQKTTVSRLFLKANFAIV